MVRHDGRVATAANSSKFAGAFVNWGPIGREVMLQAWEKWLKQEPSSVLGVDFYAQTTWNDFSRSSWVPGIWKKLNPARNVVWSVPLTVKGTPGGGRDGAHDAEFEAAAKAISRRSHGDHASRLGNRIWILAWFAKGQEADYIGGIPARCWNIQAVLDRFQVRLVSGVGASGRFLRISPIPGDDVVDYIGLDVYDFKYEGSVEERWNTHYMKAPFGLEWQRDFAARHGKLMSYPEWGVGNFGDNPFFVQQMHDWFAKNDRNIAYAAYFDVNGCGRRKSITNRFPKSRKDVPKAVRAQILKMPRFHFGSGKSWLLRVNHRRNLTQQGVSLDHIAVTPA